jgi:hypothetical protein
MNLSKRVVYVVVLMLSGSTASHQSEQCDQSAAAQSHTVIRVCLSVSDSSRPLRMRFDPSPYLNATYSYSYMTIFMPCTNLARLHNLLRIYLGKRLRSSVCSRYQYKCHCMYGVVQADSALLKHDERDLAKKNCGQRLGLLSIP